MPWCKARFKDVDVLARCDADGQFVADDGRVEIRYRPGDTRAYRAALRNLVKIKGAELLPDDACAAAAPAAPRGARGGEDGRTPPKAPDGAVIAYADGACSGNPGPAGVGIVLIVDGARREISHYLGEATNNIAELTAIELLLRELTDVKRPIRIYTDSQYAIGVLSKGWKAKANVELVARIRKALALHGDLQLHYVRGHSGIVLNDRADALAVEAVQRRESSGWVDVKSR